MPGAVADLGATVTGLAAGVGEAVDDWGNAVADCVVPELEPIPSRAGTSDDSLQATIRPIKRMTIAMLKRFTTNLLLMMSTLLDGPEKMHMSFAASLFNALSLLKKDQLQLSPVCWNAIYYPPVGTTTAEAKIVR